METLQRLVDLIQTVDCKRIVLRVPASSTNSEGILEFSSIYDKGTLSKLLLCISPHCLQEGDCVWITPKIASLASTVLDSICNETKGEPDAEGADGDLVQNTVLVVFDDMLKSTNTALMAANFEGVGGVDDVLQMVRRHYLNPRLLSSRF